jgi:cardiolipin synthase
MRQAAQLGTAGSAALALRRIGRDLGAVDFIFEPQEAKQPAQRFDVGNFDLLVHDPHVLSFTELLNAAFHRLDIHADARGELHRRDLQEGRPFAVGFDLLRELEKRIDDLRLRVAQHHDLDLILGVAQPPHELLDDTRGHRPVVLEQALEGIVIQRERRDVGERDGRRRTGRPGDEGRLAEQIAGAKHHQATLDGAHPLDEAYPPLLQEIGFAPHLALAKNDITRREMLAEAREESLSFGRPEVVHGGPSLAPDGDVGGTYVGRFELIEIVGAPCSEAREGGAAEGGRIGQVRPLPTVHRSPERSERPSHFTDDHAPRSPRGQGRGERARRDMTRRRELPSVAPVRPPENLAFAGVEQRNDHLQRGIAARLPFPGGDRHGLERTHTDDRARERQRDSLRRREPYANAGKRSRTNTRRDQVNLLGLPSGRPEDPIDELEQPLRVPLRIGAREGRDGRAVLQQYDSRPTGGRLNRQGAHRPRTLPCPRLELLADPELAASPDSAPSFAVGPTRVRLLRDGARAYPAMLGAIARAQHEILFEMYWFQGDRTGLMFRDALMERARAGVTVRVTYDAIGSLGAPVTTMWDPLRQAGAEVFEFGPVHPWRQRVRWNRIEFRDHRKLLVVDRQTGFTGGMNIGDPWNTLEAGGHNWRDDAIEIAGPAVEEMRSIFFETWRHSGRSTPRDVDRLSRRPVSRVVILADRHGRKREIRHAYLTGIRRARERVDIANPYFLPGPILLAALRNAAKRGVEVRILIPGKSDVWLVSMAMGSVIGNLLEHGVKVFAYQDRVFHAKTAIFDTSLATIGTYNLDARSRRYNRECNVAVYDRAFAAHVRRSFETDLASAQELSVSAWKARSLGHRFFAWFAYPLRQFL